MVRNKGELNIYSMDSHAITMFFQDFIIFCSKRGIMFDCFFIRDTFNLKDIDYIKI